jgi:DNA-directed RNA polymerase specialized sigma24 family protein
MTDDSRSDGELLAELPGQPELMGVLYERHARVVFRYLARRAGPSAAEDLLSEVFITALSTSARVVAHDSGSALPWLYGIAFERTARPLPPAAPGGVSGPGSRDGLERGR